MILPTPPPKNFEVFDVSSTSEKSDSGIFVMFTTSFLHNMIPLIEKNIALDCCQILPTQTRIARTQIAPRPVHPALVLRAIAAAPSVLIPIEILDFLLFSIAILVLELDLLQ